MLKFLKPLGLFLSLSLVSPPPCHAQENTIIVSRVPNNGLQPQVVVQDEIIHLVYYSGDPKAGDIFYVHSADNGTTWTTPLRVNSQPGSAIAMGTIRGATLAVGKKGRVFVAWNGSDSANPRNPAAPASAQKFGAAPLLFSRLDSAGKAFEPQRNIMTKTFDLDGGANVAADGQGHVYIAWHANDKEGQDEASRRVWISISNDEGATFAPEKPVWNTPTGACGCCQVGLKAENGSVSLLYRSASELVHRDTYFLRSTDNGQSFQGQKVSEWNINMCPMSTYALAENSGVQAIGWETAKQVYFSRLGEGGKPIKIEAAPGTGNNRKYPSLALKKDGQLLFAWTQENGWNKGGVLRFQLFDAQNKPVGEMGARDSVPVWSLATAFLRPDGKFSVLY